MKSHIEKVCLFYFFPINLYRLLKWPHVYEIWYFEKKYLEQRPFNKKVLLSFIPINHVIRSFSGAINARFLSTPTRDPRSLASLAATPRPRACVRSPVQRVLTNGSYSETEGNWATVPRTLLLTLPWYRRSNRVMVAESVRVPNTQGSIKLGFTQSETRCVKCN